MVPFIAASNPRKGNPRFSSCFHLKEEETLPVFVCRSIGDRFIVGIMVIGGRPHRSKPEDTALVDEVGKRLFKKVRWYHFLSKFSRENYSVARRFAETFKGDRVVIGSLDFTVDKDFISEETGLPQIGENWFKGKTVLAMDCNAFLKDEYADPVWKDGIPTS